MSPGKGDLQLEVNQVDKVVDANDHFATIHAGHLYDRVPGSEKEICTNIIIVGCLNAATKAHSD